MRLRNIKRADDVINSSHLVLKNKNEIDTFALNDKIALEIGMGKGDFIMGMSKKYDNLLFVGVELYSSVLLRAIEKVEVDEEDYKNLRFINCNANKLEEYFNHGSISNIYLNFSDPWPKRRNSNRRLTSVNYLKMYEKLLEKDGSVIQKTDNKGLFDFSVNEFKKNGWILSYISYEYDKIEDADNVMTEYEKKFRALGKPIYKLIAKKA